jgi:predicted ATP-grasp superfamily ATP-dependent carboligase
LANLTAQTKNLQASTENQEKELASINVRIDDLITAATPIREEIISIMAQLLEKRTEEKAASDTEAKATLRVNNPTRMPPIK